MLQSIKRGFQADANDPRFHICRMRFLEHGEFLSVKILSTASMIQ